MPDKPPRLVKVPMTGKPQPTAEDDIRSRLAVLDDGSLAVILKLYSAKT